MSIAIPKLGSIDAFAMVVDINKYTSLDPPAQFVRDVLCGSISAIEESSGEVVGFMGDAILGLLADAESTVQACFSIAKDLNDQVEYLYNEVAEDPEYKFAIGNLSLKIGVEFGSLDVSTISSRLLGEQPLISGHAIVHAARILTAGSGNRCLVGPEAIAQGLSNYPFTGPYNIHGKPGEPEYEYYQLELRDIWIEGSDPKRLPYW